MIGYTVTVYIVHSWPLATKGIDWRSSARVLLNKLFSRPFLISCLPARRFRVRLVWLSIGVSCSFKQMLVVLRGATSTLNASQRVHDSVNSVHDHVLLPLHARVLQFCWKQPLVPDPRQTPPVALQLWRSLRMRLRYADDFQALESFKITEASHETGDQSGLNMTQPNSPT